MKKVLITGGCGYIGSHTALVFLERGFEVIIVDSNINSSPKVIEKIKNLLEYESIYIGGKLKFFHGDIKDYDFLKNIFISEKNNGKSIDFVIHFAGLKSVRESFENPLGYWMENVYGTINLLKIMTEVDCKNIVFSSSATIYGYSKTYLMNEKTKISPVNPYGETKATVEKVLDNIFLSYPDKWKIAKLRYFNPIGAHNSGLLGEEPYENLNNIFPIIMKVAAKRLEHINVFGDNWPTKDGTCIRDYIHVMDVAEGHFSALDYLYKNKSQNLELNLGTGKGTSVLELINIFQRANGVKIPFKISKKRKGDVPIIVADNQLAKSVLNWEPKRTLDQMCKDGWNWELKRKNF